MFIKITEDSLQVEVLEHQSGELIVHTVSRPPRQDLTLFSRVRTDSVMVNIKSRSVEMKLDKVDTGYWSSLGCSKGLGLTNNSPFGNFVR